MTQKVRQVITLIVESDEGVLLQDEQTMTSIATGNNIGLTVWFRGSNAKLLDFTLEDQPDPSIAKDFQEDNLPHDLTHHKDCGCAECKPCKLCKLRGYEHSLCPECNPCDNCEGFGKTKRQHRITECPDCGGTGKDPAFMSKDTHKAGLTIEERLVKNTGDVMDAIQDVMEKKPEKPKESNLTYYEDKEAVKFLRTLANNGR